MQIKTLSIKKELVFDLINFVALIGVAVAAPLIGHQSITGSIVNATLFIATIVLGYRAAIAVGIIPSLVALISGTLPIPLAPMIPFIISGNAILVLIFAFLRSKNYWLGVIAGSICKFAFLFVTSSILIGGLYKGQIGKSLSVMMSYPQLITALAGGLIAFIFLKSLHQKYNPF